jgi:hypothetical protein
MNRSAVCDTVYPTDNGDLEGVAAVEICGRDAILIRVTGTIE